MECFRLLLEHLAWIEHQFLSGIRDSKKAGSLWGMMRGVVGVRKSIHLSWLAKGFGLGLLCCGVKGVQEEIPSLSQTIWPRWASRQFLTLLIDQTLLPMTFGYYLSSEAVVMGQLRRWKRLWGHWYAYTRGLPWGLSEVVGTVQQVHCGQRRLLRRGVEFHMCTINKGAHTKKVWKLI